MIGENDIIGRAFGEIDRSNFVLPEYRDQADIDIPLPIGFGQTISQPSTVRMMLKWLDAKPGDEVLDVGSGSGWSTALLSRIVGSKGKVFAVERISELKKFGQENCKQIGIKNVKFFLAGKEIGLPKYAPYDRILVSASAEEFPRALLNQLKVGGKLVVPVANSIFEVKKTKLGAESIDHQGFAFVPLITGQDL